MGLLFGHANRVAGDGGRRNVGPFAIYGYIDLLAQNFQLLDRSGSVDISRHQQGALSLFAQAQGQLASHCRLACALQAHQHNHCGRLAGKIERGWLAEQIDQFVVDDFDHLLSRGQAVHHLDADGSLFDAPDKIFDDFEVYIGFQQGQAHLAQGRVDIGLREFSVGGEL